MLLKRRRGRCCGCEDRCGLCLHGSAPLLEICLYGLLLGTLLLQEGF